jgi:hypothetical protein
MARRFDKIGGRINRRVIERRSAEEIAKLRAKEPKLENRFEYHVVDTVEASRAILRDVGLPDYAGSFVLDDLGNWRTADRQDELISEGAKSIKHLTVLGLTKNLGFEPYNSFEWFAAAIVLRAAVARAAIARGDVVIAATEGLHLGELIGEVTLWEAWGPYVEKTKPRPRQASGLSQEIETVLTEKGPVRSIEVWHEIRKRNPDLLEGIGNDTFGKRVSRIRLKLFRPKNGSRFPANGK